MHKIRKGIKKKIKGKKGKNEEIFTEEEYESYKKQKEAEKQQEEDTNQEEQKVEETCQNYIEESRPNEEEEVNSDEENTNKEDWRNFLSSADVVLKKTSENLEQIKESSYFQVKKSNVDDNLGQENHIRPATPSDLSKTWTDLDKEGFSDEEEEEQQQVKTQFEPEKTLQERIRDLREITPIQNIPSVDTEDYADIFDTTYVDQIESGEIKLNIIPESPTDYDPSEPDPFDTSGIEKILHKEKPKGKKKDKKEKRDKKELKKKLVKEVKPLEQVKPVVKKKIIVNLGSAVQALTSDNVDDSNPKVNSSHSTRRVPEINLLGSIDTEENKKENNEPVSKLEKSDVDKNNLTSDVNTDDLALKENSENLKSNQTVINHTSSEVKENENKEVNFKNIVDEFDTITNDSELQCNSNLELITQSSKKTNEVFDEFSVLAEESLTKNKDHLSDPIEDDPFDTSVAEKVIGDTVCQETSVLSDRQNNIDLNSSSQEVKEDLLATVNVETDPFDTSNVCHIVTVDPFDDFTEKEDLPEVLVPQTANTDDKEDNCDPFDTSAVGKFGKSELKYFERELLSNLNQKEDDDFDFNPREDESKLANNESDKSECLLSANDETIVEQVLLPQQFSLPEDNLDPFDTSITDKLVLKSLEKEFLEQENNPNEIRNQSPTNSNNNDSFISNSVALSAQPSLTAAINAQIDPFDTSVAESICEKINIQVENNIEQSQDQLSLKLKPIRPPSPACLLASTPLDENPTLLPTTESPSKRIQIETNLESDPFDTSIAAEFGKTELKVLETELLTQLSTNIEDEFLNFNPREEEPVDYKKEKESTQCLLSSSEHIDQPLPPLAPGTVASFEENIEVDPFDTSVADKLGTSELSYFESKGEIEEKHFDKIIVDNSNKNPPPRPPVPTEPVNCVFAVTPTDNNPALQPVIQFREINNKTTEEDIDPFDTSIADRFGKTELKALEDILFTESISEETVSVSVINKEEKTENNKQKVDNILSHSPLLDSQPILQPTSDIDSANPIEDYDPFDTSIAVNLGHTELAILESELLNNPDSVKKYLCNDEEFDPRK